MNCKKILALILAIVMVLSMGALMTGCSGEDDGKYVIGVCQLVEHEALDAATQGFMDTIEKEFGKDNVEFIVQKGAGDGDRGYVSALATVGVRLRVGRLAGAGDGGEQLQRGVDGAVAIWAALCGVSARLADYRAACAAGQLHAAEAAGSSVGGGQACAFGAPDINLAVHQRFLP